MLQKITTTVFLSIFLIGCAVKNIKLKEEYWPTPTQTITVIKSKTEKAKLYREDDNENFINRLLNITTEDKNFNKYLAAYDLQSANDLKNEFVQKLHKYDIKTAVITEDINISDLAFSHLDNNNYAVKNFISVGNKYNSDTLLVIDIKAIGASQKYYSGIPVKPPQAICNIEGQLINANNNKVLWRYNANVTLDVHGNWNQPPHYPNFTTALTKAIATSKDELLDDFFSGVAIPGS